MIYAILYIISTKAWEYGKEVMDTNSFIQQVIVVVVGGVVLFFIMKLITLIGAAIGAIYQRIVRWVRKLVRWLRQLVEWIRQVLFEVKSYCKKKRRMFAVCDVPLEDLGMVGVDISKYRLQLGDSKCIEAGMTVTVDAKDVKKINRLFGSISISDFNFVDKESFFLDKEYEVPCFVDDIHPLAKFMKLNALKK